MKEISKKSIDKVKIQLDKCPKYSAQCTRSNLKYKYVCETVYVTEIVIAIMIYINTRDCFLTC